MRFSKLIYSSAVASLACASEVAHDHHDRRAVAYVTRYRTTTVWAKAPMTISGSSTTLVMNSDMARPSGSASDSYSTVSREGAVPVPSASSSGSSSSSSGSSSSSSDSWTPLTTPLAAWTPVETPLVQTPVASPAVSPVESPVASPAAPAGSSSSSASATLSSASASASASDESGHHLFGAGARGITYSPYAADGTCKSPAQIAEEISTLSNFPVLRLYGVDCAQVESVLKAKAPGQKLFLGIYFVDQIEAGVKAIKQAVEAHGSWDDIDTISIGNELVNNGQATVDQIAGYMKTGRKCLAEAGYKGPVVSVDTFIAVINNPGLCELSDYMAVNAHPYFDFNTPASLAGPWVLQQIQRVWSACNGNKRVVITETGWPTQGQTYGKAIPSKINQKIALESIKATCGNSAILFTAFDDYWKADGPYGVEKFWGML